MQHILEYVDILIGNEKDAEDILNIEIPESNFARGEINIDQYPKIAEKINHKYPKIKLIAITLRESVSANHNRWGAMLYDTSKKSSFFSPKKK
jgi:2-dehydro-3-deoxygluconokinase